jgi:hypothetical protein
MNSESPAGNEGDDAHESSRRHPRADPSSRYHAYLKKVAEIYPMATDALMRSDRHRPRRLEQFVDAIDLKAIDSLLGFLSGASVLLAGRKASDLAFLPTRIADDVGMALEGLLSGYLQIVSDSMRDVVETEFLIRDFALDTERIDRWRHADDKVLREEFQPRHMRARLADALGLPKGSREVPGAKDYAEHSRLLHVGEPLLFARSPESGHEAIRVLEGLADIVVHGISVVEALGSFLAAIGQSSPDIWADALNDLRFSAEDLYAARAAVEAMARLAAESTGTSAAYVFENGLVIALREDKRPEFFKIDRIDFRHFHREVSPEHAAFFSLASLDDDEAPAN